MEFFVLLFALALITASPLLMRERLTAAAFQPLQTAQELQDEGGTTRAVSPALVRLSAEAQWERLGDVVTQARDAALGAGRLHTEASRQLDSTAYALMRLEEELCAVIPGLKPFRLVEAEAPRPSTPIAGPAIRTPRGEDVASAARAETARARAA